MRVTKELKTKIERLVNERFAEFEKEIRNSQDIVYKKIKAKYIKQFEDVVRENEELLTLFKIIAERESLDSIIENDFRRYALEHYALPEEQELLESFNKKSKETRSRKETYLEDLLIKISYAEDMTQLTKILDSLGIAF